MLNELLQCRDGLSDDSFSSNDVEQLIFYAPPNDLLPHYLSFFLSDFSFSDLHCEF